MSSTRHFWEISTFLGLGLYLLACSSPCSVLNDQISDALSDGKLSETESAALMTFINNPTNKLGKQCSELRGATGQVNKASMLTYIRHNKTYQQWRIKHGNKPPELVGLQDSVESPLKARLYLESSASMFAYDNPQGKGLFKEALTELLLPFERTQPGQNRLSVVNNNVYPLTMPFSGFIASANLYPPQVRLGDSRFTDFRLIFDKVLQQVRPGEVSILASDLIYSPIDRNASPDKVMLMGQGLLADAFGRVADNTSLLVLQLAADYRGTYFSETARKWVAAPSSRPYYLCLIALNQTMRQLLANADQYNLWKLAGFQNFWLFSTNAASDLPLYTVLCKDAAHKGNLRQNDEERLAGAKLTHSLQGVGLDKISSSVVMPVAIDLSGLYLPDAVKADTSMYQITGPDCFRLTKIDTYPKVDGALGGPYKTTHKLLLATNRLARGNRTVTIRIKRTFPPPWIASSHTTDDSAPTPTTTFGLRHLMEGIEQAYNPTHQPAYFTLTITLTDEN
jgi:hypothetical protein